MEYQAIETTGAELSAPRFTVSRDAILSILELMARQVIERRNTLPILSNIRIEACPSGELRITGTDLDLELSATLSAEIERPGSTTVSAAIFRDIVKKAAKGAQIGFDASDGRATVNHGRGKQSIPTLPVQDYPAMPIESPSASFIAPDSLISELAMVAPFAGQCETKYYLNGVLFDSTDGNLHCVATDGRTLATLRYDLPDGAQNMGQSIISSKAIKVLRAMAKATGESCPIVEISGNKFTFDMGAVKLTTKLIDGDYPQWRNLTPTGELSGLMLPELDSRLPSGRVEALTKAVDAPLTWETGVIGADNQMVALITSAAYPHFQAILCGTSEPVYPQGYYADGDCTVEADGVIYPVAVKSGRIHLSAETVAMLCGPVDPSTHVYIPTHTYYRGKCVEIDGVPTADMPAGYKVNPIIPKGKKRYDVLIKDVSERELRIGNAMNGAGMTREAAELETDAYMASVATPISEPAPDLCNGPMWKGETWDCVFADIARGDHPTRIECLDDVYSIVNTWTCKGSLQRTRIPARHNDLAKAAFELQAKRYASEIEAGLHPIRGSVLSAPETPQDVAPASTLAETSEMSPQDEKNAVADDIEAQPDAMAALIARMDALEAMIINATTIEAANVIATPSVAMEIFEPLPVDNRALSVVRAREEIAADTPIGEKRTAAHVRAIMAYLAMRKERRIFKDAADQMMTARDNLQGMLKSTEAQSRIFYDQKREYYTEWKAEELRLQEMTAKRSRAVLKALALRSNLRRSSDISTDRLEQIVEISESRWTVWQELASLKAKIADPSNPVRESDMLMLKANAEKWQVKAEAAIGDNERLRRLALQNAGHIETLASRVARAEAMLREGTPLPVLTLVPPTVSVAA